MSTFKLKIAGVVVLIVAVIIAGKLFWPSETAPVAELPDTERMQEKAGALPLSYAPFSKLL